jgi:hypothetical protein
VPAVRPRSALTVVAAAVGLLAASAVLAAPAVAESHHGGHANGRTSAGHAAKGHGACGHRDLASPVATYRSAPRAQVVVAQPGAAIRRDIVAAAAVNRATGRATGHGRGHAAKAAKPKTHGRHAVAVTSRGTAAGQRPNVPTGPTNPALHPVVASHPAITLRGRAAERVAITNRTVGVAQSPQAAGGGGSAVPPLDQLVLRIGDMGRFSLFDGPLGWTMGGLLLVALVMVGGAVAAGRRRFSPGTAS